MIKTVKRIRSRFISKCLPIRTKLLRMPKINSLLAIKNFDRPSLYLNTSRSNVLKFKFKHN